MVLKLEVIYIENETHTNDGCYPNRWQKSEQCL